MAKLKNVDRNPLKIKKRTDYIKYIFITNVIVNIIFCSSVLYLIWGLK